MGCPHKNILIYQPTNASLYSNLVNGLNSYGYTVDVMSMTSRTRVSMSQKQLSNYSQYWLICGPKSLLPDQLDNIRDFIQSGNGLLIEAGEKNENSRDDDGFDQVGRYLFKLRTERFRSGNWGGNMLLPGKTLSPGIFLDHPLTHKISQFYEGAKVRYMQFYEITQGLLAQSSTGNYCLVHIGSGPHRIVVDCGTGKFENGCLDPQRNPTIAAELLQYARNIADWLEHLSTSGMGNPTLVNSSTPMPVPPTPLPTSPPPITKVVKTNLSKPPAVQVNPTPDTLTGKKNLPVYILLDSSTQSSDHAVYLDYGLQVLVNLLRSRPDNGAATSLSLIITDGTGQAALPLTEVDRLVLPQLIRRGPCILEAALKCLLSGLSNPSDGKPLVLILLASNPSDNWSRQSSLLRTFSMQGNANVFVIGIGGYTDKKVLEQLTCTTPLSLPEVTKDNVQIANEWFYHIADVVLTGMEVGSGGGSRSVTPPPACFQILT
jgi:uncharacterized protein YegL